jgi:hypothetical protein
MIHVAWLFGIEPTAMKMGLYILMSVYKLPAAVRASSARTRNGRGP